MAREDDPFSPDVFQRLEHHALFARLRAEDPVHWNGAADHPYWSLTKHADVQWASRDSETFTVTQGITLMDTAGDPLQAAMTAEMLPGMDGERHTRFRRIVNRGFTPRTLRTLEDHLRLKARRIVDDVLPKGEADLVEDIAAKLPLEAICELVGVPDEDRAQMFEWSNAMLGLDDPSLGDKSAGFAAGAEMMAYGQRLRAARLTDPRDDIVTKLTHATVDDEPLTDNELAVFFLLLVVAGNETTRNATVHGVKALLDDPGQLARLQADPSRPRMERAVEEVLRWSTPILQFRRTATRDVELRGKRIAAGDWVVLWYASANRDEEVFADADRFDVDRTPNDHVTFGGGGVHHCLGAGLARMELRLILTEIVTRMPTLRLAGEPEMLRSSFVGSVKHLPVSWEAP